MSSGLIPFMKELIDNRITLLVRSEVKKQVKNQLNDVEIKLMKFIQQCITTRKIHSVMHDIQSPTDSDRQQMRLKSDRSF